MVERASNITYGQLINQEHQLSRPDFIPMIEIGDEAIESETIPDEAIEPETIP